ncbi:spoOM family protein [Anoxybacillus sp. B7M1]|jgi:sporulation-control protein|uniref:sporulation protein n=1 Tax=unclassified Anoxybacillus TaxID=2639704 RepID=UPI0005CDCB13|nr:MULTISPECIES: sporulation protein [unclassified Anoxybacillus]ANB56885.1 spoOM family protein [Anoxybacillus sp. B2M1]ANB63150.1 spoOM family protein [Anoxybacillus sp. B7M1]
MFKKLLSKLGVGSAKVNLILQQPHVRLGEKIEGEFIIEGGTVEQHIRKLDVELHLIVRHNGQEYRRAVAVIPVAPSFTVHAGERKVWPFSYIVPLHLPITRYSVDYIFVTRLDIADGVDAMDKDAVRILPPAPLEKLFAALDKLGFREKADSGKITTYGQEFAFFPVGEFRGIIQEVECFVFFEEQGLRLQLEVDVLSGSYGYGEIELKRDIFFTYDEMNEEEAVMQKLRLLLQEMVQQPRVHPSVHSAPFYPQAAPYSSHSARHSHGMMGAIGGFAAGMLAGMVAEELLDDVIDNAFDLDDGVEDIVDDWLDGDDDGGDWL